MCPGCGTWSSRVHGSYLRFPADVPSAGRSVLLRLRVRRFNCQDAVWRRDSKNSAPLFGQASSTTRRILLSSRPLPSVSIHVR
ncbi:MULTISPECIES: transposase family protein [unclassified Streptomyces]|uniref:transposase family protein n=1 Tax=unclassified Streptomyces TaxID=2593676 RepID=UPI002E264AE6